MSSERPAAPGLLLVLSAPSGAGKTTLAHRLQGLHADAVFSVSATTRAPRGARVVAEIENTASGSPAR